MFRDLSRFWTHTTQKKLRRSTSVTINHCLRLSYEHYCECVCGNGSHTTSSRIYIWIANSQVHTACTIVDFNEKLYDEEGRLEQKSANSATVCLLFDKDLKVLVDDCHRQQNSSTASNSTLMQTNDRTYKIPFEYQVTLHSTIHTYITAHKKYRQSDSVRRYQISVVRINLIWEQVCGCFRHVLSTKSMMSKNTFIPVLINLLLLPVSETQYRITIPLRETRHSGPHCIAV